MFRGFFTSFVLAAICASSVHAAPQWKAPGLVKSLREADRIVERAQLPASAFDGFGAAANPTAKKQRAEVVTGLQSSSLCAEPHQAAIAITAITTQQDDSVLVLGTMERDTKGKVFYTPVEREEIARWERDFAANEAEYKRRLEQWNRHQRDEGDPKYRQPSPAIKRNIEIEEFNGRRNAAIRPFNEYAAARERKYATVRIEIVCPAELGEKLDRPKMLKARKVSLLVHPNACDLDLAAPDLDVPAFVSVIRGTLEDVDPSLLKKDVPKPNAPQDK